MMSNQNIGANLNQPNVPNVPNVQNVPNPPNVSAVPNVSVPNVSVSNVSVPNVTVPNQLQGAAQMNPMTPMINMQHMARNQPANVLFQGSKNFKLNFIILRNNFIDNSCSSKSNTTKSAVLSNDQKKSKPVGTLTNGNQLTKPNGTQSISSIATSDKYNVTKNWYMNLTNNNT